VVCFDVLNVPKQKSIHGRDEQTALCAVKADFFAQIPIVKRVRFG
jgi:hypothetical protein